MSVKTALADLIKRYSGKAGVGDTPGNRGQCVGLVEVWTDSLGLPHTWGNAKDLLDQADRAHFLVIRNSPTNYPVRGDVVVWGGAWGGGFGHTGVVLMADVMSLTVFQQNDPTDSRPHPKLYSYSGVLGWMRPLVKP